MDIRNHNLKYFFLLGPLSVWSFHHDVWRRFQIAVYQKIRVVCCISEIWVQNLLIKASGSLR